MQKVHKIFTLLKYVTIKLQLYCNNIICSLRDDELFTPLKSYNVFSGAHSNHISVSSETFIPTLFASRKFPDKLQTYNGITFKFMTTAAVCIRNAWLLTNSNLEHNTGLMLDHLLYTVLSTFYTYRKFLKIHFEYGVQKLSNLQCSRREAQIRKFVTKDENSGSFIT